MRRSKKSSLTRRIPSGSRNGSRNSWKRDGSRACRARSALPAIKHGASWGRIDAPFEVIDYARPTRFAFKVISGPLRPVVRMRFESQGETTRLTFSADFVGRGLFRLLEPLVGRQARKEDEATFARLKANLEAGAR